MKKRLVLFDFDGTITTKDTFLEFIRFYHGPVKFVMGFLFMSPWMALMILKIIPNYKGKERVLRWFFRNETVENFNQKSADFCKHVVPALIRPKALTQIRQYLEEGSTVVVISASAENWVRPWCSAHGLNCLATQLEIKNNRITGNISGFNCYGAEKEKRIRACYALSDFDEIIAYGDSRGDLEMLALANQQHYKPFRI